MRKSSGVEGRRLALRNQRRESGRAERALLESNQVMGYLEPDLTAMTVGSEVSTRGGSSALAERECNP